MQYISHTFTTGCRHVALVITLFSTNLVWFSKAAPPEITSFTAPAEAGMQSPFDFLWEVTGEDVNLSITPAVGPVTGGSHTHTHPNQGKGASTEITFTLTARNKEGVAKETAKVLLYKVPRLLSLESTSVAVQPGAPVRLSWRTDIPVEASLDPGVGEVEGDSVIVRPTEETTYTLTARNGPATVQQDITVRMREEKVHMVAENITGLNGLTLADMDGDGDMDIGYSSLDTGVGWFENVDGFGAFEGPNVIVSDGTDQVWLQDLDGDGDVDLFTVLPFEGRFSAFYNQGDNESFEEIAAYVGEGYSVDDYEPSAITVADLTGSTNYPEVVGNWFRCADFNCLSFDMGVGYMRNQGEAGFSNDNTLINWDTEYGHHFTTADIDGDGDNDVISVDRPANQISVYFNANARLVDPFVYNEDSLDGPAWVSMSDTDGDNDPDILVASEFDGKVALYPNLGQGRFDRQQVLGTLATPVYVTGADIDGDDDRDVVVAAFGEDAVVVYRNLGDNTFSEREDITDHASGPRFAIPHDLNKDGVPDFVVGATRGENITWYQSNYAGRPVIHEFSASALTTTPNIPIRISWLVEEAGKVSLDYPDSDDLPLAGERFIVPEASPLKLTLTAENAGTSVTKLLTLRLVNRDSDEDGMEDSWEKTNLGNLSGEPGDDTDGDGYTDFQEYVAATDPGDANSNLSITESSLLNDKLVVTWTSVPGKYYTLYTRSDTIEGEWVEVSRIQATSKTTTHAVSLSVPIAFFRVGVEL